MASEADVLNQYSDLTTDLIEKVYFRNLYDIAFDVKRSWLANRIPRTTEFTQGIRAFLTFQTEHGWSWRPMTELGFTPSGGPLTGDEMSFQLQQHAGTAQISTTTIAGTDGGFSRIGSIIDRSLMGLVKTFPYYIRAMLWSPASGILARSGGTATANVVTLVNTGLPNVNTRDAARYLEAGMVVQTYTSAQAKRGSPVKITAVDKEAGQITLESDPGIASGDLFVLSDLGGQDNPINESSPGILDVIDDDNTFQGIDRSLAANSRFRSVVRDNSGTPRTLTYNLLTTFLHDTLNPDHCIAEWRVVRGYFDTIIKSEVRYQQAMAFVDGYQSIQVGKTIFIEDDDAHFDKVIVPQFPRMFIADRGGVESLFGMGWRQVPGRPIVEYPVKYWALLAADDTRYMGVLSDLNTVV